MDSTASSRFEQPERRFELPFGVEPVQCVAVAYAAWLFGLSFVFHLAPDNKILLEIALIAGMIPAMLHCLLLPIDTRGNGPGMWFLWAFMVIFLLSYLVNSFDWEDLANLANVMFVFMLGILIASTTDTSLIMRIVGVYALMMIPFLVYINMTGERVWGRLHAGAQPNVWGLFSLNVAIGAFALKNRILQGICMVVVMMTMYNAQTRGSMVALMPTLVIFAHQFYAYDKKLDITWKMIATYAAVMVVFGFVAFHSDVLINDVLRLHDPQRGLDSGATGRDQTWREALHIWFRSPLLGVGFRKHEEFMVYTEMSAHNAYIAMLADTGFVGFIAYMCFLIGSLVRAFSVKEDKLRLFLIGLIISYALAGLFERRAINVGNSFSISYIFCCLIALRLSRLQQLERKVSADPPGVPALGP
ncbi:MAG: O-antigen ligase family protein [Rhodospirillales bacterium]|nr:O-antigen ligase family protein [Rhodospirillales bacterium]